MKKIIAVLLSALMVGAAVTSLPLSAGAASVEQGVVDTVGTPTVIDGFHIVWNGDNYGEIVKYTGDAVNLTIPQTIGGYEINEIGSQAFSGNDTLKSVVIESKINTLGESIFYDCENLESVTLPNGFTEIADSMFYDCYSLESINLPSSITSIGTAAFMSCISLKSIAIPSGVQRIEYSTFFCCYDLTDVTIPSTVTYIGDSAFYGCSKLTNLTLGSNLTEIDQSAFSDCDSLISITLPASLKKIGYSAFSGCDNLETVTGGSKVEYIGDSAFSGTKWDERVSTIRGKETYIGKCFYKYVPTESQLNGYYYTIKNGTKFICSYPFADPYALNAICIPSSVEKIVSYAFEGVYSPYNLTDVYYMGTEGKWTQIDIGFNNYYLNNATIHYDYGHSVSMPKITVFTNGNSGVTVKWKAVDGASVYRLFRRTSGDGSWVPIATTGDTSYTDYGVNPGETYSYSVRCVSSVFEVYVSTYYSKGWQQTYIAAPVLKPLSNSSNGVNVSWVASAGAVNYRVYRKNSAGAWVKTGETSSTCFVDKNVESGKTYTYTVKCISADGSKSESGFDHKGKTIQFIAAPVLKPLSNSSNGVNVSWVASAGAVNYRVYRKNSAGAWVKTGETSSTCFVDKNVESGKTYTYTVKCISADGSKSESGFDHKGKTIQFIAAPVLKPLSNSSNGVNVSWVASAGAVNYRVYRKNSAGAWVKTGETSSTCFVDKNVESGKTYTYTVKCISADGSKSESGFDNKGKTIQFIAAPVLKPLTNALTGVSVSWEASAGAANYRVYRKNKAGTFVSIGETTSTDFVDTDAKSGNTYTYTVKGINNDGISSGYDHNGQAIRYISAPVISKLSNTTEGVKIEWNPPPCAGTYRICRLNDEGNWIDVGTATNISFVDTNVESGKIYTYTVKCTNKDGEIISSFYPGKKIKFIAAPVIYSLTKNSSGITVKWNKPAGSTNNYKVFRRANNGIFSSIGNVTTTSFNDTTVQTGNTYYYTVRVLSADGKTNLSGYISSDYIKY